jgi:AraC-like DNA-binding protein
MGWTAAVLARDHWRDASARATVAFLVCCIAHALMPPVLAGGLPPTLVDLVAMLALLLPFSFWVLAKVHFEDEFRFGARHLLALVAIVACGYVCWRGCTGRLAPELVGPSSSLVFRLLPRLLGIGLLVHAFLTIYVGRRSDLVVARLRLRTFVLFLSGTYILMELLGEALLLGSPAEPLADLVNASTMVVVVFFLTAACARIQPEALRPPRLVSDAPVLDPRLADELRALVEREEVYRQEGLTIGALAERLHAHEYKVRQLINDQLGFRNFNAFLNHYRIKETQRLLADPAMKHLSVAEIAYQVGYRSLGPFNKAFKDATGLTPTEFRSRPGSSLARTPPRPVEEPGA